MYILGHSREWRAFFQKNEESKVNRTCNAKDRLHEKPGGYQRQSVAFEYSQESNVSEVQNGSLAH